MNTNKSRLAVSLTGVFVLMQALTLPAFSASMGAPSLDQRVQTVQELVDKFQSLCMDSSGKVLTDVSVIDTSLLGSTERPIFCAEEATRLQEELKSIQAQAAKVGVNENCPNCEAKAAADAGLDSNGLKVAQLLATVSKSTENACTPDKEAKYASMKCIKDASCFAIRSILPTFVQAMQYSAKSMKMDKEIPECVNSVGKSDCFSSMIAGVVKDLVSNVTGIWDLVKLGGNAVASGAQKAGQAIASTWNSFFGVEDKLADAALASTQQSQLDVVKFTEHPLTWLHDQVARLWGSLESTIQQSFMCEKWSGVPHMSQCVKPYTGWKCATCDAKLSMVCGVGGFLGGEVLVAYFTGEAIRGGQAANAALVSRLKALAVVEEKIATGFGVVSKGLSALIESRAAKAILSGGAKFGATKAGRITVKVLTGNPAALYIKALNHAFEAGMRNMDRRVSGILAKAGMGEGALSKVSEFRVVLSESDAAQVGHSYEELIEQLKADKVGYKEVTLADGQRAIEVELPKVCRGRKVTIVGLGK